MNIIGISSFFHDSACCILKDGCILAAAQEERFSRIKADPSFPKHALKYCLRESGLSIGDIDYIAYYENPGKKLERQRWSGILQETRDIPDTADPNKVEDQIREISGFRGEIKYIDHHLSHAASSFFFSGFPEAAILTVDGVGEWATTTYGAGSQKGINTFEEVLFPNSLGLLYSTITSYLGFGVNDGEYKVMGLAPYGQPVYADHIRRLIGMGQDGQYTLDMQYFSFLTKNTMYSPQLPELLGKPPREEDSAIQQFHTDVARSMQMVLEEVLIEKSTWLYNRSGSDNLCMAGGVALNCVANSKILNKTPFRQLFVQPAANDSGGAIGAAAMVHFEALNNPPPVKKLSSVLYGPSFASGTIHHLLASTTLTYVDHRNEPEALLLACAHRLANGKVLGWFQGRMEFGPRSLGARSIIADPRNPIMRDRINQMVKKRENFRPFAPAVLDAMVQDHFDLDHMSPFMLETCQVRSPLQLPAITHVDGSARVQTVDRSSNQRFYDLIEKFYQLTGCPILLNTSFNVKGEPIVCTPEDALNCFVLTQIDALILGDFIIDREDNDLELLEIALKLEPPLPQGITHQVYTFV